MKPCQRCGVELEKGGRYWFGFCFRCYYAFPRDIRLKLRKGDITLDQAEEWKLEHERSLPTLEELFSDYR